MSARDLPTETGDEVQPTCPSCRYVLTPATDVLYQGIPFGGKCSIDCCGWCGTVLGGGPSSEIHFLGTKTRRGGARHDPRSARRSRKGRRSAPAGVGSSPKGSVSHGAWGDVPSSDGAVPEISTGSGISETSLADGGGAGRGI